MKKRGKYFSSVFSLLLIASSFIHAQIDEGGVPYSFSHKELKAISGLKFETMPFFDIQAMLKEDSLNEGTKGRRFAKGFNVSFSLNNSGTWETLNNGDKVWRLGIRSPSAYSINIIFSEYNIPDSAKVFIFNQKTSHVIGAFTSKYNSVDKSFATMPVKGDEIVVEYFEPKNAGFKGKLTIGKVSHDYRGFLKDCYFDPPLYKCKGASGSCEVDINCPQGNNWQDEKHAVCLILINGESTCTASLLNNTARDGTPYLLTANHCVCSYDDASTILAYFNYESPTCGGGDGNLNEAIYGTQLLSNSQYSDFALLKLNPPVINNWNYYSNLWNLYYLGWDRTDKTPPVPVTCIHHPEADVKKISISNNSVSQALHNACSLSSNSCSSNPCILDATINVHSWYISAWTTGITEPGSSGSPLLDNCHRVIGQDYAGHAACGSPIDDYFGRFSQSWYYSSGIFSSYLDPKKTGATTLDGLAWYMIMPPNCHTTNISNQTYTTNTSISDCQININNSSVTNNSVVTINAAYKVTINGPFSVQSGSSVNIK